MFLKSSVHIPSLVHIIDMPMDQRFRIVRLPVLKTRDHSRAWHTAASSHLPYHMLLSSDRQSRDGLSVGACSAVLARVDCERQRFSTVSTTPPLLTVPGPFRHLAILSGLQLINIFALRSWLRLRTNTG